MRYITRIIAFAAFALTTGASANDAAEIAELRALVQALSEENESLKMQLADQGTKLEDQEAELVEMREDQRAARREQRKLSGRTSGRDRGSGGLIELGPVSIGGALRANYTVGDYDNPALDGGIDGPGRDDGGSFTLDTFYLNAGFEHGNFIGEAEYRFYDQLDELGGYHFIHTLWGGYRFNNGSELKLGVVEVPFSSERFGNSYGFFNSLENVVGLSDDRDLGITYSFSLGDFDIDLGYFYGEEPNGTGQSANSARGSYDVASPADRSSVYTPFSPVSPFPENPENIQRGEDRLAANNFLNGDFSPFQERNQLNLRVKYNFWLGETENVIGASIQYGELRPTGDVITDTFPDAFGFIDPGTVPVVVQSAEDIFDDGEITAGSIFLKSTYRNWQMKAGLSKYHYDIDTLRPGETFVGFNPDQIVLGAYDIPIFVASEGTIPSIALSYTHIPRNIDFIDWVVPYVEYSAILKDGETNGQYYIGVPAGTKFEHSEQLTFGAVVGVGDFIIYFDTVFGKGSPLIGNENGQLTTGGAFNSDPDGAGPIEFDEDWQMRFNINVGYYF
jgi:hypothetical protein